MLFSVMVWIRCKQKRWLGTVVESKSSMNHAIKRFPLPVLPSKPTRPGARIYCIKINHGGRFIRLQPCVDFCRRQFLRGDVFDDARQEFWKKGRRWPSIS